jgi:hypothetical protein
MIRYLAGGRFGDFIHSLSVVNENYLKTGERGIVYLSEAVSEFAQGLETTYNDTKKIVLMQDYIHSYKIHNGEEYDIDLSEWRKCDYVSRSYPQTMNDYYSVKWGAHPWINNIPHDISWADKTVIWTIEKRFPYSIDWTRFSNDNIIFVSFDENDYTHFCNKTGISPKFYEPESLMELCVIIHSCNRFVASFSGFLALAFAMHARCHIGEFGPGELFASGYEKALPNIYVDFYNNSTRGLYHS